MELSQAGVRSPGHSTWGGEQGSSSGLGRHRDPWEEAVAEERCFRQQRWQGNSKEEAGMSVGRKHLAPWLCAPACQGQASQSIDAARPRPLASGGFKQHRHRSVGLAGTAQAKECERHGSKSWHG